MPDPAFELTAASVLRTLAVSSSLRLSVAAQREHLDVTIRCWRFN
jgi:hypothetical protein